ncbi:MAG: hypothetical protein COB36_04395 [Alphaproteobacteria bacterium]|nr:MAG: hypothetical protein COB36_04395 [Alphaproteobacteria bacterium]
MTTNGQPFFFDNNLFDDEALASLDGLEKPEFTKSQLESIQKEAFEKGKHAGFEESETSTTKNILSVLEKIERDMTVLFAAENDREEKYEEEAVNLTFSIMRKIFPLYMAEYGEKELQSTLKNILSNHNTPEKIKIEVPENLMPSLDKYIKNLEGTLDKHITLTANADLKQHECHILWPDGGVICNRNIIAEKTLGIMKEALAERGVSVHDKDEPDSETSSENEPVKSDISDEQHVAGET